MPYKADAGDDGGARAGNEWIGLALGKDDKVASLMRPGDRDIQVSGGCRSLHSYRNNMERLVNCCACVGSLLAVTNRAKAWGGDIAS